MSYNSAVVLVLKKGIAYPADLPQPNEIEEREGFIILKWNWLDWYWHGKPVDAFMEDLDEEGYYFLREGEGEGDYETRGLFTVPDVRIGIIIPDVYEPSCCLPGCDRNVLINFLFIAVTFTVLLVLC